MSGFTPIRVALLTSGHAPAIEPLLADPNRGALYDVVCVLDSGAELEQAPLLEAAKIPLVLRPEMIIIYIIVIAFRQPLTVRPIFARVPIVIVPIFLVVCPTLVLFLLVPFVLVLGPRHGHCAYWRHQRRR